jgi:PAS domain S-box-containing protein
MLPDDAAAAAIESRVKELAAENQWLREELARVDVLASQMELYVEQRSNDARRFHAVLANNPGAILLLNPQGVVVQLVHSIMGYSQARLVGRSVTDVMRPDSAEQFLSDLERVVQTPGGQSRGVYCHVDAAGGDRWLEGILTDRLEDPAIHAIVYNCRDITENTVAEPKLALMTAIVESSGWAIVSQDFDGCVLSWNPGAVELYGYTAAEMAGNNIATLLAPGQSDDEAGERQRIRDGGAVRTCCTTRRRKDGCIVEIGLRVAALRDKRECPTGCVHMACVRG